MAVVCSTVAHVAALAVACTVGRAYDELCPSVAIEVVDDEWHVVSPRADVDAHVDTPEQLAVCDLVAVEDGGASETVVGIVVGVGGVPLQDDLIFSVAVDISY